jgi:hypothetical protein
MSRSSKLGFVRAPASISRNLKHFMPKKLFLSGSDQKREPENRELLRTRASISRNLKHFMPKKLKAWICVSSSFDQYKPGASHAKEALPFKDRISKESLKTVNCCELQLRSAEI